MSAATDLVIAETEISTWSYHLRRVVDGKRYLGGGAPPALCGARLGWDTTQPLSSWGLRSHIPETWCRECARIAFGLDGILVRVRWTVTTISDSEVSS